MTGQPGRSRRFSLWRWSRLKLESKAAVPATRPPAPPAPAAAAAPSELPPVESLTFESDFAAFLRPDVDDRIKRAALKQLFRDPRFNIMDGLDTYIDDYTQADPIAPDVLADLLQRGFDRVAEASPKPVSGAPALRSGPVSTTGSPAESAASIATPAPCDPSPAGGSDGAIEQQRAAAAPASRAEDDEVPKRTAASQ